MIEGRCLALRRGGEWVFPKGHLEAGERPPETAVREVREECGLDVRIIAPLGTTRYEFQAPGEAAHRKWVHWFVAEPTGGHVRLEPPFEESRLLDARAAQTLLTHDSDRELADRAFRTR